MFKRLFASLLVVTMLFSFSAPAYASWKTKAFGVGIGFAVKHVIKNGAKAATNSFRTVKGKQAYDAAFNKVVLYSRSFINELKIKDYVRTRFIPKFPKYEKSAEKFLSDLSNALSKRRDIVPEKINGRLPINYNNAGKVLNFSLKNKAKESQLIKKYGKGIKITNRGFPDFSKWSKKNVRIKLTGNRKKDSRAANNSSGASDGNGWTWHHNEDIGLMELIPSDLHGAIRHTGGYAIKGLLK